MNSGIQDMLVESGVYGEGTAEALLRGDSYNRGARAHKIWNEFTQWLEENEQFQDNNVWPRIVKNVFWHLKMNMNLLSNG